MIKVSTIASNCMNDSVESTFKRSVLSYGRPGGVKAGSTVNIYRLSVNKNDSKVMKLYLVTTAAIVISTINGITELAENDGVERVNEETFNQSQGHRMVYRVIYAAVNRRNGIFIVI